jgi:hypothetical protein
MNKPALSSTIKFAVMTLTVLAVALLGLVGGVSWTGVALADDPGTVPQGAPQALLVEPSATPDEGDCGLPSSDTTPAFVGDPLSRILEIGPGTSQLLNTTGVASYTADTVAPEVLPGSPVGYDLLSCGILTSGQSAAGGPLFHVRRPGQYTCFIFPEGTELEYQLWIHYYDPSPLINRWVRLVTIVDLIANTACTSLRLPALFALFGLPII